MKCAVTLSASADPSPRDFLRHTYVPYLEQLGILPVPVPNVLSDPVAWAAALGVEGIVLTGGGDVAPERYGQPNTASSEVSPARDTTEFRLLEMAVARRLPVLGICRGIQVLNVFFGGGLVQDIAAELHSPVAHNGEAFHRVTVVDPRVASVIGTRALEVNSSHHQAVTAAVLAPDLTVFAICEADGVIEGVLHRALPVLGVQWHPERPSPSREHDLRLLRRFLAGAFWLGA